MDWDQDQRSDRVATYCPFSIVNCPLSIIN